MHITFLFGIAPDRVDNLPAYPIDHRDIAQLHILIVVVGGIVVVVGIVVVRLCWCPRGGRDREARVTGDD